MDVKRTRIEQGAQAVTWFEQPAQAADPAVLQAIASAAAAHNLRIQSAREYLLSKESRDEMEFLALRPWLQEGSEVSTRTLGAALRRAVVLDKVDVISFLLSTRKISLQAHGRALEDAAHYQNLKAMKVLLWQSLPKDHMDNILIQASNVGRIEPIRMILEAGIAFRQATIANAVQIAARRGFFDIILLIYPGLREKTPEVFSVALVEAVQAGQLDRVQFFLRHGPYVLPDLLGRAITIAAAKGHLDIMRSLLFKQSPTPRFITRENIDRALRLAQENFHHEIVILCRDFISVHHLDDRISAIMAASRQSWRPILASLIARGPITAALRDDCMQLTADRRTLDLLITASLIPEPLQQMPRRRALRLTVDMIKAHPEQLLDDIHREGLPYEVSFTEALGMSEDGGVVKKFTTILIASAIKHRLWKRNGFGLLTSTCDVDDRRLATLGRLYEMIDMRNSRSPEPILFGPLLHPRFFELVMIAMSSSTDEEKIAQLSLILGALRPDLAIIALIMINPSITNKALVMQLLQCPAGSELEEAKRFIRSFLRASRAFSQDLSPAFRAKISSDPVKVLRDMQGETVTAELILSALRIQDGAMDLVDKFEWLKDKIAHASAVYLRRFLICVTGKQTLSVKDQLIISRSRHPDQFEYRSCFNNLALPHGSLSKQAFYDSLEASLLLEFERY